MSEPSGAVYTIEPGTPFLPCLAARLLDGTLTGGDTSAELLARSTVYLPNRRAVVGLQVALADQARLRAKHAVMLPAITALSDVDEDALELALPEAGTEALEALDPAWLGGAVRLPLQPAYGRLDRQLALTRLIMQWGDQIGRALFHPGTDVPLLLPKGPADAANMALELSRLLDEFQIQDIPRSALDGIVPDQLAAYWALSHRFLDIVLQWWEDELAENERLDPIARRNALILAQAAHLETANPAVPFIIAGSTGSVPATAKLMKAVLGLPLGSLVLPGLDTALDDAAWSQIVSDTSRRSAQDTGTEDSDPGHPQYGLKRLIDGLGVARKTVRPLRDDRASTVLPSRANLISEVFRPAAATAQWPAAIAEIEDISEALAGLSIIDAENERLEALAIAVCLREVLADTEQRRSAFLVTPDRMLARRVSSELLRWGVVLDDSAGVPLSGTAPGRCFMALAGLISGDVRGTLLSVLRSGFVRCAFDPARAEAAIDAIELLALRSGRDCGDIHAVQTAFASGQHQWQEGKWLHPVCKRLASEAIADGDTILTVLAEHLGQVRLGSEQSLPELVDCHFQLAEAISGDDEGATTLWNGQAGTRLHAEIDRLRDAAAQSPNIAPETYHDYLRALFAGITLPQQSRLGRIAILGPLEARLQSADRIILGGLNEGTWPAEADTDPWLSRPMRTMAGLEAPERRIGLAAHDLSQAMGAPEVILTRSHRVADSPAVASRWLQRLDAVAGKHNAEAMRKRGNHWLTLATTLDHAGHFEPQNPPLPTPPLHARPRRLSVTSIETLIRDPYAIYGRHVLKLHPLDPINPVYDHRLRGTIIHAALEGALGQPGDNDIGAAFLAAASAAMTRYGLPAAAQELWRARLERIATWLAGQETTDRDGIVERFFETDGALAIDNAQEAFHLTARADRIDILRDATARIIDYKTGAPPSEKQVTSLLSPQLPLEALVLAQGGFSDTGAAITGHDKDALVYWHVTGGVPPARIRSVGSPDVAARAATMLAGVVDYYDDPSHGYRPRVAVTQDRYGSDYDHLSRYGEWSLAGRGEVPE
ncbi:MAG: double-strand break repair protein AddB [Pseudomonadota bacterium]